VYEVLRRIVIWKNTQAKAGDANREGRGRNFEIILLTILVLGFLIRLPGLASRPMWYDEAFSVLFSRTGLSAMLEGTLSEVEGAAADVHPLLYYSVLWGWMRIVGESPVAVRALSILISLGVLILAWRLAYETFGPRTSLLAIFLVALSPFQIHYAQEARMYGLLTFWLLGATLVVLRGLKGDEWWPWIVFGILSALAMYTHVLAVGYLIPLALTPFLVRSRWACRRLLASGVVAVALYLPWLLQLPTQIAKVQQAYWISRPGVVDLVQTMMTFVTGLPVLPVLLPFILFTSLLIVALVVFQTMRAARLRQPTAPQGLWMAFLTLTPVMLIFLVSQWRPVFIQRALLPSGTVFLIWLAWVFECTRLPKYVAVISGGILLLGMAAGIVGHMTYAGFPYAPYAEVDADLQQRLEAEDIVLHSSKLTMLPAIYYDEKLPHRYLADPPSSGSDTLALPTQQVLGLIAFPDVESAVDSADSVFFIIFSRELTEYQELGLTAHPHLPWLEAHFNQINQWKYKDLLVYEFSR